MERKTHTFEDRAIWLARRRRNLNSTETCALFGLSPYQTALELALTKDGKIDEVNADNERTAWGRRLQDAIAAGVYEEHGTEVTAHTDYIEIPELRIGSSFDFNFTGALITRPFAMAEDSALRSCVAAHGAGLLEIKNLDNFAFAGDWQIVEGQLEAAPHIELQLQHQMLVSGYQWGAIAALIGGNTLKIIIREYDEAVGAAILKRAHQFWCDLAVGKYPPAKMPMDAEVLARLYNFSEPGTFLDGTDDKLLASACASYNAAAARAKTADEEKDVARSEVLQIIRDHEKAVTAGYKISTWMVAPYERPACQIPGFRGMRITKIKTKEPK